MHCPDPTRAFDGRADVYARNRFDYAPQAIEAIVAIAGLDRSSVIADLGAGTGMLSRHFADRVGRVHAIEPNDDMRAQARASVGHHASLRITEGTAHDTGLPDHSVDAVMAGRAIQWFDRVASQAEIRRILRPGGWLIVLRTPVTDPSSKGALERLREVCSSRSATSPRPEAAEAEARAYFGGDNCVTLAYPCTVQETWAQFCGRLQSLSYVPQQSDPGHEDFVRLAREIFEAGAVDGLLRVDYTTSVLAKQMSPAPATGAAIAFNEADIEGDIVSRFERVVDLVPDAVAIKAGTESLQYAALDACANAVAAIVLRESPDPARPVALLFDHGLTGIACLLGVLKAGRPFCALAPGNPLERQRESLADLQSALLLCEASQREVAETLAGPGLRCERVDLARIERSDRRPDLSRSPGDIAAIYYTSGTTGKPKGVALSHRYFLHRVWLSAAQLQIAPGDRFSQIPGIGFVTAAADITMALLSGATLCPFDAGKAGLPRMAAWLNDDRIGIVRMPVALFNQFLDSLAPSDRFPHVRVVHPAGKLHWSTVDRYRAHFRPECRLLRQLAATETSVLATGQINHASPRIGETVPVGYPVPGKELWLESEDATRTGVGEVGEIVVRSRYLFSGFWRQAQTGSPSGEARIHRTGDLGRWLADGSLEFVGRIDARVKIRGFTVDLVHVESALEATGLVAEAAVVSSDDPTGNAALVAYVVPRYPHVTPQALRTELAKRVADFMIPSRFVALDALPMTMTGKVHRSALPALQRTCPVWGTTFLPPRTPTEERVAAVWKEALGLDAIGIEDEFLVLGGDSLVAARIANRVLTELGVALAPGDLFLAPTVARMAALVDQRQGEDSGVATPPGIVPRLRGPGDR